MFIKTIKKILKKLKIDEIYRLIKKRTYPIYLKAKKVKKTVPSKNVLNQRERQEKIIISLTSFPERIYIVINSILSLMNQRYKPDMIILWLAKQQFLNLEKDLPSKLLELKKYGLTICWCDKDIRSYKKLIPTYLYYPEAIIVTCDDDLYYPTYWLSSLVKAYKKNPDTIPCQMITPMSYHDGEISFSKLKHINKASYCNKILSGSGALFPPKSLYKEVLNQDLFLSLAPTNDDLWFWAMAILNNRKILHVNKMKKLLFVENSQEETSCLWKINNQGENLRTKDALSLIKYYNLSRFFQEDE